MRPILLVGCTFISLVLGAAGGFCFGVREAWDLALMENAAHLGMIAVPRLVAIQTDKCTELARALEFDVDNGLIWSHYFLESPLLGFLRPVWGIDSSAQNRQELNLLASYRKTNPSPLKPNTLEDVYPETASPRAVEEGPTAIEQRLSIINDMVKRYATKP
jgi:hypothetical protein